MLWTGHVAQINCHNRHIPATFTNIFCTLITSRLLFYVKDENTLRNYYPNSVLLAAENIFIYFTQRPRFRDVYSVYSVYRVSRESRAGRAAVSWPSQTAVSHASTIS